MFIDWPTSNVYKLRGNLILQLNICKILVCIIKNRLLHIPIYKCRLGAGLVHWAEH